MSLKHPSTNLCARAAAADPALPVRHRGGFTSRRHVAWLLWLALLLPLGQAAAAWHAMSHVRLDVAGEPDGKAVHSAHCDLCLVAAAVTGGAPAGPLPAPSQVAARHAVPLSPSPPAPAVAPVRAYRSRAPPIASR